MKGESQSVLLWRDFMRVVAETLPFRPFKIRSEETNKMYSKEQILAGRKIRDAWNRENSPVMYFAWTL